MSFIYPEVELNIESETIAPKERKLKVTWTMEAAVDVQAVYNPSINLEEELTKALKSEIQKEIDDEIIKDLTDNIMEEMDEQIMREIAKQAQEAEEQAFRWKVRKKKIIPRSILDEWEISRFD